MFRFLVRPNGFYEFYAIPRKQCYRYHPLPNDVRTMGKYFYRAYFERLFLDLCAHKCSILSNVLVHILPVLSVLMHIRLFMRFLVHELTSPVSKYQNVFKITMAVRSYKPVSNEHN